MNNVESKIGISILSKAKEEIMEDGMREIGTRCHYKHGKFNIIIGQSGK